MSHVNLTEKDEKSREKNIIELDCDNFFKENPPPNKALLENNQIALKKFCETHS